ncbi:MAG: 1-deoxy-D-xylulose-5-phosphate synthase [Pseudomonadota bacterium]|nr:1-deoxy-D-xylulose-5-phosphate synthase [Pseudomonadota bacterium]
MMKNNYQLLDLVDTPNDLKKFNGSQLTSLASEIRDYILEVISKTGGHLAAGLGTVELSICLHYIFNTPHDKIIWDVGHQCYPHKILTGRKNKLLSIRKYKGISGFLKINESEYDVFGAGHSSTSISAALGMCIARDRRKENYKIISVIGDGGITAGMSYEALCHAGYLKKDMLVILNDNEMSISPNVGAMNKYLTKILSGKTMSTIKQKGDKFLSDEHPIKKIIKKIKDNAQNLLSPGHLFEEIGFRYYGPIDGHDISSLNKILDNLKDKSGPILLHVITKKGKGYKIAEKDPIKYHGVTPFNIQTGASEIQRQSPLLTYTNIFSKWINDAASKNENFVAITPAMREGSGLVEFEERYPDRFFDVGIAEQHSVTLAAGLAVGGLKPIVAIYSTFLQRAYDQLIHDVNLQNLDVFFAIDRAGLVGADGETHHGIYDISFMRILPNIVIMTPSNEKEMLMMLNTGLNHRGPCAIRYPRGNTQVNNITMTDNELAIGKSQIMFKGQKIAVLVFGQLIRDVAEISKKLSLTLVDMRFVKPLDKDIIDELSTTHEHLITIEDNVITGGAGSSVNEYLVERGYEITITNFGIPDRIVSHGNQDELYAEIGLDKKSLEFKINEIYNHITKNKKVVD